jgi:hypothetical protein
VPLETDEQRRWWFAHIEKLKEQGYRLPEGAKAGATMTDGERAAVKAYSFGGQWEPLNEALREGRDLTVEQQRMVQQLDSAIDKAAPIDETVYRGLPLGVEAGGSEFAGRSRAAIEAGTFEKTADWAEQTYTPGYEFSLGGYQSTARNIEPALDASHTRTRPGVVFEIKAKKGLSLKGLQSEMVNDEAEVLLPRSTRYRVGMVERRRGFEVIDAGGYERTSYRTVIVVEQL